MLQIKESVHGKAHTSILRRSSPIARGASLCLLAP
uniref:Uncharacterized protein n=1 Tax=Arundo donax TaxID=35708 RepID=A0A0A8YLR2_ARUDO